jgi:nitrite reductase (NADH) small subunit
VSTHVNSAARRAWRTKKSYVAICDLDEVPVGTGVAALVKDEQIAIVRSHDGAVYALSNFDPFSRAFVISRGIVGDRGGTPKIASPVYKQSFDLRTGRCLDDPRVSLISYPVRVQRGRIFVSLTP